MRSLLPQTHYYVKKLLHIPSYHSYLQIPHTLSALAHTLADTSALQLQGGRGRLIAEKWESYMFLHTATPTPHSLRLSYASNMTSLTADAPRFEVAAPHPTLPPSTSKLPHAAGKPSGNHANSPKTQVNHGEFVKPASQQTWASFCALTRAPAAKSQTMQQKRKNQTTQAKSSNSSKIK